MPVYNGEKHLQEAMDSILEQTYSDFELIIINDGSEDKSQDIILSYSDQRIRYYTNNKNLGLTKTLNIGLDLAKGEYIARMDADDLCVVDRFSSQVSFFEANKDYGLLGTAYETFGAKQKVVRPPIEHREIEVAFLFDNAFAHPATMFRRSVIENNKIKYRECYKCAEDYDLLYRISQVTKCKNLPDVFLRYRVHDAQVSKRDNVRQVETANILRKEVLASTISIDTTVEQSRMHQVLSMPRPCSKSELCKVKVWAEFLVSQNASLSRYGHDEFQKIVAEKFWEVFRRSARTFGPRLWGVYLNFYPRHALRFGLIGTIYRFCILLMGWLFHNFNRRQYD